jgi:hypothetical protein
MYRFLFQFLFVAFIANVLSAQCTLTSTSADPYQVIVHDISYNGAILTQNGPTCNARIVINYDVEITDGGPSLWTFQGRLDCVGSDGTSFFGLPNSGGTGTSTSATFSYNNTQCSNLSVDCIVNLEIAGRDLSYNGPCGSISSITVPVDFLDIHVLQDADRHVLVWTTAREVNSDRYEIMQSSTGHEWTSVGEMPSNNEVTGSEYKYALPTTADGTYYRVKSIDYDGAIGHSSMVYVRATDGKGRRLYPNPASDQVFVADHGAGDIINVYDLMGRPVIARELDGSGIDISALLPGMYRYTISQAGAMVSSGSLVKQ